jgi:hypothetical protein
MSIVEIALSIVLLVFMASLVWHSSMIIEERKQRYRAGTHDYYDNPIEKDKDETVHKRNRKDSH